MTLWEEIVDAINAINGSHPGFRAVHAKGTVCEGSFTATPEAAKLSRAAHLQGEPVKATVRFSNASGNPNTSDANPIAGRGMASSSTSPTARRPTMATVPLRRVHGPHPRGLPRLHAGARSPTPRPASRTPRR